jgi:integrase
MTSLERYLAAATRKNTQASYAQATRHFEEEFGGFLPATGESVARYLAAYAGVLSNNTLRQRLSALAAWHRGQGFADPTRDELVRQAFKGIRALHGTVEKQAAPLQLADLERVDTYCRELAATSRKAGNRRGELQAVRDRAMLLLGFWRAFRSDDLVQLQIEQVLVRRGESLSLFLPTSKGDRENQGRTWMVPALTRLCPVEAVEAWLAASNLSAGPLFRRVSRWGTPGRQPMNRKSIIPWLRRLLAHAGIDDARSYTSHSLRRGFAGWAAHNGWDLKALMQYVGWRDVQSAARYVDPLTSDRDRLEAGLKRSAPPPRAEATCPEPADAPLRLEVSIALRSYVGKTRGIAASRRHIEEVCLARLGGQKFGRQGDRYHIQFPASTDEGTLTERVSDLLDELHQVATNNECYLEARIRDVATGRVWD